MSDFDKNLSPAAPAEPKYVKPNPEELAGDILFVKSAACALQGLAGEMTPEEETELNAIIALDELPAKAIAMGAYTGLVGHEVIYQSWAKARNARDFLATRALMVLAEVMDGRKVPAQVVRICEKLIEWSGMGSAPAPIGSDSDKLAQMAQADVSKLTDAELQAKVTAALKKGR